MEVTSELVPSPWRYLIVFVGAFCTVIAFFFLKEEGAPAGSVDAIFPVFLGLFFLIPTLFILHQFVNEGSAVRITKDSIYLGKDEEILISNIRSYGIYSILVGGSLATILVIEVSEDHKNMKPWPKINQANGHKLMESCTWKNISFCSNTWGFSRELETILGPENKELIY